MTKEFNRPIQSKFLNKYFETFRRSWTSDDKIKRSGILTAKVSTT